MSDMLARVKLLDAEGATRVEAVSSIESPAGRWALRTALRFDQSAQVRAMVATRLGKLYAQDATEHDDSLHQLREATIIALEEALEDVSPMVRHEAARTLGKIAPPSSQKALARVARTDEQWWVRRCAVVAFAALIGEASEQLESSTDELRKLLDDPAWRVRLAVVDALEALVAEHETLKGKVLAPLRDAPIHASTALSYLAAKLNGEGEIPRTLGAPPEPTHPLYDPDPAVVAARLEQLGPTDVAARTLIPWLADPHTTLRNQAIRRLADSGDEEAMREALRYLDEPRIPYVAEALREVLYRAPWAQKLLPQHELVTESVNEVALPQEQALRSPDPLVRIKAVDAAHALEVFRHDEDASIRRHAFGMLVLSTADAASKTAIAIEASSALDPWLRMHAAMLLDPTRSEGELDALVRLVRDTHPAVRAAVLDKLEACDDLDSRIESLLGRVATSESETRKGAYVWYLRSLDTTRVTRVLADVEQSNESSDTIEMVRDIARAADVLPMKRAEVSSVSTSVTQSTRSERVKVDPSKVARRVLGRTGIEVSRLGMSGVHNPKSSVFHAAQDAGVNLFFWEQPYTELASFSRERRRDRDQRVWVSGTYHGDAASYERDVDTALRRLKIERLDVFLLFWVRSRARVDNAAFDALSALKEKGKIRSFGFSTHHRDIALEAVNAHPWDVLMVRHSAAHRGAEKELLPELARREIGVLTFTNVCYGRLLQPVRGTSTRPLTAEECYRYTLAQDGVSACWSAPRWYREVLENVRVLDGAKVSDETLAAMRAHGDSVYAASQRFNAYIRQAPTASRRGVRTIALERLDGLDVPSDIAGVEIGKDEGTSTPLDLSPLTSS
ncbi:MAG: aldo/keto reductase [Polyangiaceae bacterium]